MSSTALHIVSNLAQILLANSSKICRKWQYFVMLNTFFALHKRPTVVLRGKLTERNGVPGSIPGGRAKGLISNCCLLFVAGVTPGHFKNLKA